MHCLGAISLQSKRTFFVGHPVIKPKAQIAILAQAQQPLVRFILFIGNPTLM